MVGSGLLDSRKTLSTHVNSMDESSKVMLSKWLSAVSGCLSIALFRFACNALETAKGLQEPEAAFHALRLLNQISPVPHIKTQPPILDIMSCHVLCVYLCMYA